MTEADKNNILAVIAAMEAAGLSRGIISEWLSVDRIEWIVTAFDAGYDLAYVLHIQMADYRETVWAEVDADDENE